jgi:hypothetical protein
VGGEQALAGLTKHGHGLAPGAALGGEPGLEVLALDVLHGDVDAALPHARLVDADDVGVGEAGEGLGLAQELGAAGGGVDAGTWWSSLMATRRASSSSKAA